DGIRDLTVTGVQTCALPILAPGADAADLENHPHRHLVLQELIHGEHFDADGSEESWSLLHRAAELKSDYSDQVHFLLANHDLAQIGRASCRERCRSRWSPYE